MKSTFPDDYWDGLQTTSSTIEYVPIDAALFSDVNGEIIGFTVLVAEDEALGEFYLQFFLMEILVYKTLQNLKSKEIIPLQDWIVNSM